MVWMADRRARRHGRPGSPVFWLTLALLLLFLGINKQLDLQTLLNDIGRRKARAEGWYGNRRYYQTMFIAAVTVLGVQYRDAQRTGQFEVGRRQSRPYRRLGHIVSIAHYSC